LTTRFPGWTFSSSGNTLADNSLIVREYQTVVTHNYVGAEFWVEYHPTGIDPTNIH